MSHSPEPWAIALQGGEYTLRSVPPPRAFGDVVCSCYLRDNAEANARRICACVNACQGISTEELEEHGVVVDRPRA